jgi:hypothetical protein
MRGISQKHRHIEWQMDDIVFEHDILGVEHI